MHNLIHLAIPGFLLLLLIEVIAAAWMHQELFEWKDTAASLSMGIGNVIIGLFTKVLLFASYSFVHRFAIFNIGYQWWAWVLLFFAEDFTYYVFHRSSHECRFFWASHVVHHSSQRYNLGTALRQTWTGRHLVQLHFLAVAAADWLPTHHGDDHAGHQLALPVLDSHGADPLPRADGSVL